MGDFEVSKSTRAFSMDDSFRNPLPVEMSHFICEDKILEQDWSTGTHSQGGGLVSHWGPGTCGHAISAQLRFLELIQLICGFVPVVCHDEYVSLAPDVKKIYTNRWESMKDGLQNVT